jgi:hypothetical protein
MTATGGDALGAALIQLAGHGERIAALEVREDTHHQEVTARLRDLAAEITTTTARANALNVSVSRHAAIVNALDGLDTQVAELARQLASRAGGPTGGTDPAGDKDGGYQPVPTPRWWKLRGPDRDAAAGRLRAWVETIYRPGYGKVAAALPPCWEQHPFCLYTLDWLSELWSALYLAPQRDGRTLAAQAEWQTRLLPAAAEQMAYEAAGCAHQRAAGPRPAASRPPSSWHRPPA